MDTPMSRLNKFEAGYGAGLDPAGRLAYAGPGMMYASPGDFARTQQVHNDLKAQAGESDPSGMMIRQLLEQIQRQNLPAHHNVEGLMGSYNAPSTRVNVQNPE